MDNQEIEIELNEEPQEIEVENSDIVIRREENVIESISVNGVEQEVDENKNVDISVPTKLSDLTNDNNTVQDENYVHTDNNYTNAEKNKLANLENYDDREVKADISDLQDDVSNLNTDITDLNTNKANKNEVYTKTEADDLLEGKADKSEIPTKTSDLTNDNGFIDKNVNNLTNYTLKTSTGSLIDLEINQSTYVVTLRLKDVDGNVISSGTIDLPLENVVIGGSFDSVNKKIVLTLENGNTVDIPVGDLVAGLQTEITSSNKLASDLVDDSNSGNKFVTTSEKQRWNDKLDESDLQDYVKNTDYATVNKAGVIKTNSNYGLAMDRGNLYCANKTYEQYDNMWINAFLSKGTLENVIAGKGLINQTTLDESQAEQDTQIQANTESIENIENNLIPTGTATGENITINDSARYKFKEFGVGGNTTQGENPSPSNPQQVVNVGTRKNLFDKDNANIISDYALIDGGTGWLNETNDYVLYVPCQKNTKYKISKVSSDRLRVGTTIDNPETYPTLYQYTDSQDTSQITITTNANANYLCVFYRRFSDTLTEQEIRDTIKIEDGTSEVNVKVQNKNLYVVGNTSDYTGSGTLTIQNNNLIKLIDSGSTAYCIKNEKFYINDFYITANYDRSGATPRFLVKAFDSNGNQITSGVTDWEYNSYYKAFFADTAKRFTSSTTAYVQVGFAWKGTQGETGTYSNIMLTTSSDTSYETHEEQTATLTLPEGMEMCKIGDYKDSFVKQDGTWYKNKVIGKSVLDGSENWNRTTTAGGYYRFFVDIGTNIITEATGTIAKIYSNNFSAISRQNSYDEIQGIAPSDTNFTYKSLIIYCNDTKNMTTNEFKTWLSTHNTTVYYVLATPILEEITDETLISQLDNLYNLYSYKGITYISSDDEISPNFEVEYYKDIELMIQNLLNQ